MTEQQEDLLRTNRELLIRERDLIKHGALLQEEIERLKNKNRRNEARLAQISNLARG